jgi:hypothetical protein
MFEQVLNTNITAVLCKIPPETIWTPPKYYCVGKDCLWYVFRVKVRVLLRFGFRFGVRFRFKVLKGRCVCVCSVRVRD